MMLFEELVEQHRVDGFIANIVRLALVIASHERHHAHADSTLAGTVTPMTPDIDVRW